MSPVNNKPMFSSSTTSEVLTASNDLDGVLADYSSDAVLFATRET